MKSLLAGAAALLGVAATTTRVSTPAPVPVVVELFTSEGCSSCPAADAVLRELESSQPVPGAEIIALGEHVDYWNRLGWQDAFSTRTYTTRQGEYARHFGSGSYTPQAVVQGRTELVGSQRAALLAAIREAAQGPHAQVELSGRPGSLQVRVSALPAGTGPARVLLFITESNLSTQVGAGENAGALLRHAAVVRSLQDLGPVAADGTFAASPALTLLPGWNPAHLRAVAVVQAARTGRVVGAVTRLL